MLKAAPTGHTMIHYADVNGDIILRLTCFCPECHTAMIGRENDGAWSNSTTLTVIPVVCPKCDFGGGVTINFTS